MTNPIDPTLMQATDDAFWAEFNNMRSEMMGETTIKRYVVVDGSQSIRVVVTDANIEQEKKIVV